VQAIRAALPWYRFVSGRPQFLHGAGHMRVGLPSSNVRFSEPVPAAVRHEGTGTGRPLRSALLHRSRSLRVFVHAFYAFKGTFASVMPHARPA
jgi:hypothetical protein